MEASRAQWPSSCILSQLPWWRSSLACLSPRGSSAARSGVLSGTGRAARGGAPSRRPGDVQVQPLAQLQGSFIKRSLGRGRPQVQSVAVGAAAETVPTVPLQVGGERAAARRLGTMYGTRATHLVAVVSAGHETQQL